jgi:biotin carboxylase
MRQRRAPGRWSEGVVGIAGRILAEAAPSARAWYTALVSRRTLVLVTTASYRTDAFVAAARALEAEVVIGSDRCHQLAEVWPDEAFARVAGDVAGSLALDFRDPAAAASAIVDAASAAPFDAIVPTDDITAWIGALAARRLGLPGNAPEATSAARNKAEMRRLLRAAAVPCPRALRFRADASADEVASSVDRELGFPCVVKPLLLSGSRGVIRADDPPALAAALARVAAILRTRPEFADGTDPAARELLVEEYVPGGPRGEVALEGILRHGALRTLALYDKPDALDGPFFEETIYVTPSRLPDELQRAVEDVTARAAAALGLSEGPIHAELRLPPAGPVLIEIAARSIGGLCARTLRFTLGDRSDHALEELVLRHALGLGTDPLSRRREAAGVLMVPIPTAGVLRAVEGVDEAKRVPDVEDVVITARLGDKLVPLPEGSSYLGFVFARAEEPAAAEAALRRAHRRLRFDLVPVLAPRR